MSCLNESTKIGKKEEVSFKRFEFMVITFVLRQQNGKKNFLKSFPWQAWACSYHQNAHVLFCKYTFEYASNELT